MKDKGHGLVWEDISPPPEAMVRTNSPYCKSSIEYKLLSY